MRVVCKTHTRIIDRNSSRFTEFLYERYTIGHENLRTIHFCTSVGRHFLRSVSASMDQDMWYSRIHTHTDTYGKEMLYINSKQ